MLVPVGPGLFMVEAQRVEQLMLDDRLEDTPPATQGDILTSRPTANKRETPETESYKHLKTAGLQSSSSNSICILWSVP